MEGDGRAVRGEILYLRRVLNSRPMAAMVWASSSSAARGKIAVSSRAMCSL